MITRFVKLSIEEDKIEAFKLIFHSNKHHILKSPGCLHVELLQDINAPTILFTFSKWENEGALNNYRDSLIFKEIWKQSKETFQNKAEAWSVENA
jgi:quinol monooxygenase YgiN